MPRFLICAAVFIALAGPAVASPVPAEPVEVPVLARAVEKGETLEEADFTSEQRGPNEVRGALPLSAAVGMEARRRLNVGAVLRASDVMPPQMVRRGEPVNILVARGGLSISAMGRALSGGAVGDQVRVVSTSTNRTLEATVSGPGVVNIMAP